MSLTCPRCGAQNTDTSKFCLSCGNDLRSLQGPPPAPQGFGGPPAPPQGFGPPPAAPQGFGPPPAPPQGFGPPPGPPQGFGPPPGPPQGFGAPPPPPQGFGPPPGPPQGFGPPPGPPQGFGAPPPPPQAQYAAPPAYGQVAAPTPPPPQASAPGPIASGPQPSSINGNDVSSFAEGLRTIAIELRGIAASKTILSTQLLPSPIHGVASVAIRYGRSMHVLCAGGPFAHPLWPSRDFADRDRLLAATIGSNATPDIMIPWVLTYVLPGVFPDLGRDAQAQTAFLEAADAFGVGVDAAGIEAARRQGFPEIGRTHARFLVVSEPKQSIAGIELRWGDRAFEMLYVPTPGVVARAAPWT